MQQMKCKGCSHFRDINKFQEFKTCDYCRSRQKEIRKTIEDKKRKKRYYEEHKKEKSKYGFEYRRTSTGRYKKAKSAALRANLIFDISFEQYTKIISNLCFYCAGFFPQVAAGSGLDKLDPIMGYTLKNCVSCCDTCNTLKNNVFSPEETKAAIEAIIKIRRDNV
jgi:hypothetical protein